MTSYDSSIRTYVPIYLPRTYCVDTWAAIGTTMNQITSSSKGAKYCHLGKLGIARYFMQVPFMQAHVSPGAHWTISRHRLGLGRACAMSQAR